MKKIARFEKVSFEQFKKAMANVKSNFFKEDIVSIYDKINLPRRATKGSAGYDFFLPFSIKLSPGETISIPSGIKVFISEGWVLKLYPRSGLGFKFRLQLDNTVGIIDSDFYNNPTDEGHIIIKLTNNSLDGKELHLHSNSAYAQGIFVEYGITVDDEAIAIRKGGMGSTS